MLYFIKQSKTIQLLFFDGGLTGAIFTADKNTTVVF
jgi:hypothetical protein